MSLLTPSIERRPRAGTTPSLLAALAALFGPSACGDDGGTEPGPEDVARCQEAAAAYAALCTDDGSRTCQVAAYGSYCPTASNPVAAAEALDCLRASSEFDSCRTFADPSGAQDCVEAALGPVVGPELETIASAHFELCSTYLTTPFRFEPPFSLLSPAQIDEAARCIESAADCEAADACLAAGPQAALAACFD